MTAIVISISTLALSISLAAVVLALNRIASAIESKGESNG